MRINHDEAIALEYIVRDVYNCDRFGAVGLASADFLERSPLSAAVAVLAPLSFNRSDEDLMDVSEFWDNYRYELSCDDTPYNKNFIKTYISDLRELVNKYY